MLTTDEWRKPRHPALVGLAAVMALVAVVYTCQLVLRPRPADAAGPIAYPDLISVIPANRFHITHPTSSTKEFDYEHIVFDAGDGPLDILPQNYNPTTNFADGVQELYSYDANGNKVLEQQLPVHDQFFFHVAHGHYHFPLASFGLYGVSADGSVGTPVAVSPKNGFCIGDSVRVDPTLPHSPSSVFYNGGTCTNPTAVRGIDPGWGDLYDARDPGQSIDITGLPDGDYWFRAVADPDDNFVESDKSNNTTDIKIRISGDTVTPIVPLVSQGSFVIDAQGYDIGKGPADIPPITTTGSNELLVAFVSAQGGALPQTATVAGGGLNWTLASRSNGQAGTSEVWTAMAPAPLTNAVITSNTSSTGFDQQLTVMAIKGASGVGAIGAASGGTGAPSVPVTTTAAGSWVMGVGNDPDHYTPRAPAAGQEIVQQWVNEAGSDDSWVQAPPSPTTDPGTTVTLADNNPVRDRWNFAGVELLPAPSNDHTPPVISGLSTGTIGPDRANVNWSTDELSTSQVEYGTTAALGQSTTKSGALITAHTQQLTGLSPSTTYFYRVHSIDSSGNEAVSATQQFTTTPPRTTPAVISNVHVSDLEPDQATFAWTTDEPTNSRVEYGTTASYGGTSPPNSTLTTAHFLVVTGLVPSTAYHYRVGGTDPYGNDGVSGDFTLTTPALPPPITVDTTVSKDGKGSVTTNAFSTSAPGELLVAFVSLDGPSSVGQSATVSGGGVAWSLVTRADVGPGDAEIWQATAPATLSNIAVTAANGTGNYDMELTVVAFQGAAGVGNAVGSNGSTATSVSLSMTGSGSVVYAVGNDWDKAAARTPLGGQSIVHQLIVAAAGTFWTQALNGPAGPVESVVTMGDSAPVGGRWNMAAVELVRPISVAPVAPTISGVGSSNITSSKATVSWATDQPSSTQIDYGTTTAYGTSTTLDSTPVLSHSQTITGLSPSTTYHYRVRSVNAVGTTNSGDFTFTTTSNLTPQTISFGAFSSKTLSQSPITATATASSGLTVSFSSTTTAVCTSGGANGATITLVAVGTCTIKADQPGNATFAPAPSVSQSFAVTSGATGSLAVDTTVFKDGKGAQTTAAFSTAGPGEVLVAFVGADGPSAGGQKTTVTGAGLTWSLVKRTNTQAGVAEIWTATAASALSGVTVKSTLNSANFDQSLTVVAFSGAGGIGASASASAAPGAPSVGVTTTQPGSLVFGVGNDWDRAVARTPAAGQSLVHQFVDSGAGDTFWSQSAGGPFASAGTLVSLGDTAPANDRFNLTAVEVIPSNATPAAPTIFGVTSSGVTASSATISWTTDVGASSQVEYGTTTSYGATTTLDSTAVTAHLQVLGGLAASTTYHYRVISGNGVGTTTSGDGSFVTSSGVSSQTISFAPLADRTLAQSPFTVAATATSGLVVTFSSTTSAVCTTSGPTGSSVTLLTTGTCTIKADQPGNASFTAAQPVSRSFTVLPNASGTLAVDKTVFVDGTGNQTTAAFSTAGPNEVLVAFVGADSPSAGGQRATVSGAGLTWTMVRRSNTQAGDAEIWTANAPTALSGATVTSSLNMTNKDQSLTVVAFKGAAGVGANALASGSTGAPTVSLTTTGAGSLVFGVGNDWDNATARTPAAGQTLVHQFVDTRVGDTFWCQSVNGAVAAAGTVVTVGDTAPTTDRWNYAAVEILSS